MNAITVLKEDHRRVKQLFRKYEQLGDRAYKQRAAIVKQITEELSQHAEIEEVIFYPQARKEVPATEDEVLESLEEHHIVKWTLSELEKMDPKNERYNAKVTVLIENVKHHIAEEEGEFFPKVAKKLDRRRLNEIGDEMEQIRSIVPKRPHPRSPDTPPGNIVASAVATPVDVALEGARAAAKRLVGRS